MKLFKILTNLEKFLYWPLVSGYFSRISQTKNKNKDEKSVADPDPGSGACLIPGSGIRCLFDPRIRDPVPLLPLDPAWVKYQDPDSGSSAFLTPGSGIRCLYYPWIRDG